VVKEVAVYCNVTFTMAMIALYEKWKQIFWFRDQIKPHLLVGSNCMIMFLVNRPEEVNLIQIHELAESTRFDCYTSWRTREETYFSKYLLNLKIRDKCLCTLLHDNQFTLNYKEHPLTSLCAIFLFLLEVKILAMFKLFSLLRFIL
jgi:hypothetical protein